MNWFIWSIYYSEDLRKKLCAKMRTFWGVRKRWVMRYSVFSYCSDTFATPKKHTAVHLGRRAKNFHWPSYIFRILNIYLTFFVAPSKAQWISAPQVRIGHNGCFISLRILKISILPTSRAQHFYFIVETVRVQIVSFCEITLLRSLIAVTSPSGLLS